MSAAVVADRERLERARKEYSAVLTSWAESRERHLAAEARAEALAEALREIIKTTGRWGGTQGAIRDLATAALAEHGRPAEEQKP